MQDLEVLISSWESCKMCDSLKDTSHSKKKSHAGKKQAIQGNLYKEHKETPQSKNSEPLRYLMVIVWLIGSF